MSGVTDNYLKEAITANNEREGKRLNPSMVNELLPEVHEIVLNRTFKTKDPIVLEYYYNLARKGKFGERVGYLMAQDAYGKIPKTHEVTQLSTEEKINNIVVTVSKMTNLLQRTQKLTETSITNQTNVYKYMGNMGMTIKSQGILLETIRKILLDEGDYSKEEISAILNNIKTVLDTKE